ncbi:2-amino-4-hydroxy-6-hydroxymethyldihydropteridine diphosphokinase [Gordonia sinesedis]
MAPYTRAVLSAGSNIGDADAHLRTVVDGFAAELVAVSRVYLTAPWGGVEQPDFHNITLIVEGRRTPADWLAAGADLERAADRTREVRWGPRTLDVDVITVDVLDDPAGTDVADGAVRSVPGRDQPVSVTPVVSDDPTLTLPHPRAAHRAFVLVPWLAIDPAARLWTPSGMRAVADLVDDLPAADREGVRVAPAPESAGAEPGRGA